MRVMTATTRHCHDSSVKCHAGRSRMPCVARFKSPEERSALLLSGKLVVASPHAWVRRPRIHSVVALLAMIGRQRCLRPAGAAARSLLLCQQRMV